MKDLCAIHVGVVVIAVLSAGPALAQQNDGVAPGNATRWYVGGAIGAGGFRAGYDRTEATLASTGASQATISPHAKDAMWKGYLGYQLSRYFSIEGAYWDFGKPSYTAVITSNVPATTMQRRFSVDGYGADAVLWLPMGNAFSAFGKIGAINTTTRATSANPGGGLAILPAETSRKLSGRWGLGMQYEARDGLAFRFEGENVRRIGNSERFGAATINMWSLGVSYRF